MSKNTIETRSIFEISFSKLEIDIDYIKKFLKEIKNDFLEELNLIYKYNIYQKEKNIFIDIVFRKKNESLIKEGLYNSSEDFILSNVLSYKLLLKEEINNFYCFLKENDLDFNKKSFELYNINKKGN